MTYSSGNRTKALNAIRDAIADIPELDGRVYLEYPESAMPNANAVPSVFIGRGVESIEGGTTMENRMAMAFHVIAFVQKTPETPLEITKAAMQDMIESKLFALNIDTTFRGFATQLFIDTADAGTLAVTRLGYTGGTFPPYGAIRLDGRVDMFQTVI